jgi:hypothetical protein
MTNHDKTPALVVKNGAGDYFVVPQELLERGRVPAEHRAEVERLIAAATQGDIGGYDVQGHGLNPVLSLFVDGVRLGYWLGGLTELGPGLQPRK